MNEFKVRNGLIVASSGSTVMSVDGASGRLFSVDDSLSGSLFSVNTAAGLPVIEAFSDNTVRVGQFGKKVLFVSQSAVGVGKETPLNTTLDVSGSFGVTGSVYLPSLIVTPTNTNVVTLNTTTGQLGYTSSAALGGAGSLNGGATSYIPLWTSATSLSSSIMYQSASSIGINTTTISNEGNLYLGARGTDEGGQLILQAGTSYTSASMIDTYGSAGIQYFRILKGTNTTSDSLVSQFNLHTKQFQLPAYNSTLSFTGSVAAYLAVNSNGDVITTSGSSAITLSGGKTNYNTIWNSTSTLSTGSIFQYSSTQIQLTGSSLAVGNIVPSATVGRIDASNDIVSFSTSDSRFKINVKPIENALSKIEQINGVEFDWLENPVHHGNKGHDVGVIAQELEQVLPEVVTTRDSGYKAVKYDKIVALLIQAVKEQQTEINELKAKINGLTK